MLRLSALCLLLTACASPDAELELKGRVFPMDAETCQRLAVKTGGICYSDSGADLSADAKLGE